MDKSAERSDQPVRLSERRVATWSFQQLYRRAMVLVEEANAYLDGQGRDELARLPPRPAALYTKEALRLSSRLMQIATWLLLHRSVRKGELSPARMAVERSRVSLDTKSCLAEGEGSELPPALIRLVLDSLSLERQVRLMDLEIYGPADREAANPVPEQLRLLQTAFSRN
jgi:regulator of CtrA degradation